MILRIPSTPVLYTRRRRSVSQPMIADTNMMHEPRLADRYLPPPLHTSDKYKSGENVSVYSTEICRRTTQRNISCPGVGVFPRAAQSPSVLGEAALFRSGRQTSDSLHSLSNSNASTMLAFQYGQLINHTLTGVPGATSIRLWLRILNTRFAGPMR